MNYTYIFVIQNVVPTSRKGPRIESGQFHRSPHPFLLAPLPSSLLVCGVVRVNNHKKLTLLAEVFELQGIGLYTSGLALAMIREICQIQALPALIAANDTPSDTSTCSVAQRSRKYYSYHEKTLATGVHFPEMQRLDF